LLPILANGGDRLTREDHAEQPGSIAAFAPPTSDRLEAEQERGGGNGQMMHSGRKNRQENYRYIRRRKNLIHPMVHIKRVTIHSSDLRIMRVSSQTVAFRRDLRIRGLRSTIGATDQKSQILVNSEASINQF
jgi:hypothetical protein